jgi:hypothetical protein
MQLLLGIYKYNVGYDDIRFLKKISRFDSV